MLQRLETRIYLYIYLSVCVCVCVFVLIAMEMISPHLCVVVHNYAEVSGKCRIFGLGCDTTHFPAQGEVEFHAILGEIM
jgi:hypothetical protein